MSSYGPSCAWARHAVRLVATAMPGPAEADKIRQALEGFERTSDLTDDGREGLRYAFRIALNDHDRRQAFGGYATVDSMPGPLTVKDIAAEEGVSPEVVIHCMALAREQLFDTLSDRQIRRLEFKIKRCGDCGRPISLAPLDAGRDRHRYCSECSTPAAYTRRSRARAASSDRSPSVRQA